MCGNMFDLNTYQQTATTWRPALFSFWVFLHNFVNMLDIPVPPKKSISLMNSLTCSQRFDFCVVFAEIFLFSVYFLSCF